jgi:hypothetical protein
MNDTKVIDSYRADNLMKSDLIKTLKQNVRSLKAEVEALTVKLEKSTHEKIYWQVKYNRKTSYWSYLTTADPIKE